MGVLRGIILALALAGLCLANSMGGDLTVVVRDAAGLPVENARIRILSRSSAFSAQASTDDLGVARFRRIALGPYGLEAAAEGFSTLAVSLEIASELPVRREITLTVEPLPQTITIEQAAPLLDPADPAIALRAGRQQLDETQFQTIGRSMISQVTDMPGWLLEANAVLHPRGSEYDTQYVIDGVPVYDNRSIGFAPAFEVDEFESMQVSVAGVPAEFGRRLGGVIELFPRRANGREHHPEIMTQGGSFGTLYGSAADYYQGDRSAFSLGARGGRTNRYLDPPSLDNFTNSATQAGFFGRFEQDLSSKDRLSLFARSNRVSFLVPNDLEQQAFGQRQDRRSLETTGQAHYQRVLAPSWLLSVRGMGRDVDARLWSNELATPVFVDQDRGIREGVASGQLVWQDERHTVKIGGDYRTANVREYFALAEPDELPNLDLTFDERLRSHESSVFIQDHIRLGALSLNVGARFDTYEFLVSDTAFSPRVAASYYWNRGGILFRAAYDRMFQTPPLENLILSSSTGTLGLDIVDDVVPVPASRADFFEVGFRKSLGRHLRLDASHYWREFDNYFDDDVFLNTGIGFPISFAQADIEGTDVRLEMPFWRGFTATASYSNMRGLARSPVSGGLFVQGGEAEELRDVVEEFPISQDQRNTVSASLRYEIHPRVWVASRWRYGSGLPIEFEDDDDDNDDEDLLEEGGEESRFAGIPAAILNRINVERGRVRPNWSLDFTVGMKLWQQGQKRLTLQLDAVNVTDRLNVINFSGLFSGTALAPPRMFGVKLRAGF